MAILTINTGTGANKGDGDSIRTAFNKINYNFSTLENVYIAAGVASFNGQGGVVTFTSTDIVRELGFLPYPNSNPNGYVSSANLANYVTLPYLANQGFVSTSTLEGYNYAPISYVNSALQNYATYLYVDTQGFITAGQLSGYNFITRTDLLGYEYQTATGVDAIVRNNLAGYVTTSTLGSYATQLFVQNYVASANLTTDTISSNGRSLQITDNGILAGPDFIIELAQTNTVVLNAQPDNKKLTLSVLTDNQTDLRFIENFVPSVATVVTTASNFIFNGFDASLEFPPIYNRYRSNPGTPATGYAMPNWAFTPEQSRGINGGYPRILANDYTNTNAILTLQPTYMYNPNNPVEGFTTMKDKSWKYGKSISMVVDTARADTVTSARIGGTVTTSTVGYNYIDVSQGGIAIDAHVGEVFVRTNKITIEYGNNGGADGLPVLTAYTYRFNTERMVFPHGSFISDGLTQYGYQYNGYTGNIPGEGGVNSELQIFAAKGNSLTLKTTNTSTNTTSTWRFSTSGILTLPVGGDIRNSLGVSVLGGGGSGGNANTGNFQFAGNNIGTTDGSQDVVLAIQGYDGALPTPNLIDVTWSFNTAGDLVLPGAIRSQVDNTLIASSLGTNDNGSSVSVDGSGGRIFIRTFDLTTLNTWEFGLDGSTTLPSGAVIGSQGNIDLIQGAPGNQLVLDSADSISIITSDTTNVPSQTWQFKTNGAVAFPGINDGGYQLSPSSTQTVGTGAGPTVVYTSTGNFVESMKAFVKVRTTGNVTQPGDLITTDTQVCEMLITCRFLSYDGGPPIKQAVASIYGVTHTSATPLATFTVNVVAGNIQILAEPTAAVVNGMDVTVIATETLGTP